MKVRITALVLAGVLCAAAPAWSDALSVNRQASAAVTVGTAGEFDSHNPQPEYRLRSDLPFLSALSKPADSSRFELFDLRWDHRTWVGVDRRHDTSGDPTAPTGPVSAPEPSTLPMLALGLIGLLGSALLSSRPRSRTP